MTIFITAVIAALSAQTAMAEQRENRPFNVSNGRTVSAATAPRVFVVNTPGGGSSANSGPTEVAATKIAPSSAGARAVAGTVGRSGGGHGGRGVQRAGKAYGRASTRRVDAGGAAGGPAGGVGAKTTAVEDVPPNYTKPGALIRDTGQLPIYEKAETPRTHTVDAGEIVFNDRKGADVGKAPSLQQGPKDTLPPPNPGTYSRTSTGGAAANSGASTGSGSGGSGGTDGGLGGGHDNNGSGNNDKNMPGDSQDGRGGIRTDAMESAFNAAF